MDQDELKTSNSGNVSRWGYLFRDSKPFGKE